MGRVLISGAIALVLGAASWTMQGPLPGDVAITQGLQSALGTQQSWAFALTQSATLPMVGVTLLAAAALAWWVRGMSGVVAIMLAYGLALVADKALRAGLFVARPSDNLVAVAVPSSSSGLPSTFGLIYGALFGVALLARASQRRGASPARLLALAALVIGASARVVLGGHWASQMLASLAAGLLLAALATRLAALILSLIAGKRA